MEKHKKTHRSLCLRGGTRGDRSTGQDMCGLRERERRGEVLVVPAVVHREIVRQRVLRYTENKKWKNDDVEIQA